jgi:hypothetical protein
VTQTRFSNYVDSTLEPGLDYVPSNFYNARGYALPICTHVGPWDTLSLDRLLDNKEVLYQMLKAARVVLRRHFYQTVDRSHLLDISYYLPRHLPGFTISTVSQSLI